MKPIQMVDLKSQYEKISLEVQNEMQDVIESCAFINGPKVQEFQAQLEKYLDIEHVIPCANGTDALQVALMALDLKPGDEVYLDEECSALNSPELSSLSFFSSSI